MKFSLVQIILETIIIYPTFYKKKEKKYNYYNLPQKVTNLFFLKTIIFIIHFLICKIENKKTIFFFILNY